MKVINVKDKFKRFDEHWSPKVIAELNGQQIKLAKVKGEFIWHSHKDEDELFFVTKGTLKIEFRDHTEIISEGEMIVIPKGVEHKPIAEEEVELMLFEPATTKHTGEVDSERTVTVSEFI